MHQIFLDLVLKWAYEICTTKVVTDNFNNIEIDQLLLLVIEKRVVGGDSGWLGLVWVY